MPTTNDYEFFSPLESLLVKNAIVNLLKKYEDKERRKTNRLKISCLERVNLTYPTSWPSPLFKCFGYQKIPNSQKSDRIFKIVPELTSYYNHSTRENKGYVINFNPSPSVKLSDGNLAYPDLKEALPNANIIQAAIDHPENYVCADVAFRIPDNINAYIYLKLNKTGPCYLRFFTRMMFVFNKISVNNALTFPLSSVFENSVPIGMRYPHPTLFEKFDYPNNKLKIFKAFSEYLDFLTLSQEDYYKLNWKIHQDYRSTLTET